MTALPLKKVIIASILLLSGLHNSLAQTIDIANFDWADFEKAYVQKDFTPKEEANATVLFQKIVLDVKSSISSVVENYLFCTAIHISSNKGIEANNRIYLPFNYSGRFVQTKARVTNSKGEVIELTSGDIKEAIDEQTKVSYRYFALEGLDIGSKIEYFYILEKPAELSGKRIVVQGNYDINNYHFKLNCDKHLVFGFKTFGGQAVFEEDTSFTAERSSWDLKIENISAFEPEEQAANEANKLAFIYKLESNNFTNTKSIYSYTNAANFIYAASYIGDNKQDKKAKTKFLKSFKIDKKVPEEQKARIIENHIKNNYSFSRYGDQTLGDLNNIVQKKIANQYGYIKLFTTALNAYDIKHEIVLTSNRFSTPFDKEFEGYNYLDRFLIYIKSVDKYLSPHDDNLRLGYVPPELLNNNGLFIKKIKKGKTSSTAGVVKFIKGLPCETTTSQLDINIDFEDDIYASTIDFKATKTGYYTNDFRYYYGQLPEDKQIEFLERNIGYYTNKEELIDKSIENYELDKLGIAPLIMKGSYNVESFIESAGNKYIFKLGELIGAQVEMYNDVKERRQDIDAMFARKYVRNIQLSVPENYKLSNLESIRINKSYLKDDDKAMQFKSDYTYKDKTLTVRIDEYYNSAIYGVELFDQYKEVINAAADFNKVVVYLDKE